MAVARGGSSPIEARLALIESSNDIALCASEWWDAGQLLTLLRAGSQYHVLIISNDECNEVSELAISALVFSTSTVSGPAAGAHPDSRRLLPTCPP